MLLAFAHCESDGLMLPPRSEKESRHSTDLYTDKLLEYLGDRPSEKPFCAILTYSAPHWPLQCPASIRRK